MITVKSTHICANSQDILLQKNEHLQQTIEQLKEKSFEITSQLSEENERLKSEFSTLTKEIGNVYLEHVKKLSQSVDDLKVHLNLTEKEKIDQSVFSDFIEELEMLNKRIFNLEKIEQNRKSSKVKEGHVLKKEQEELAQRKQAVTKLSNI